MNVLTRPTPEQDGDENMIGPPGMKQDFDCFLYEHMGFSFCEGQIGSEKFWYNREDIHVHQVISSLTVMQKHCARVIEKLELVLRIKKASEDPRYIPAPGDVLLVPDVAASENVHGVVIKGGIATVLDIDGIEKVWFYDFPEVPFRVMHVLQNQLLWMDKYGLEPAHRVDETELDGEEKEVAEEEVPEGEEDGDRAEENPRTTG